jgi:hypothetical protein
MAKNADDINKPLERFIKEKSVNERTREKEIVHLELRIFFSETIIDTGDDTGQAA